MSIIIFVCEKRVELVGLENRSFRFGTISCSKKGWVSMYFGQSLAETGILSSPNNLLLQLQNFPSDLPVLSGRLEYNGVLASGRLRCK